MGFNIGENGDNIAPLHFFFFLTVLGQAVGSKKCKRMLILNLLLTEKQAVGLAS